MSDVMENPEQLADMGASNRPVDTGLPNSLFVRAVDATTSFAGLLASLTLAFMTLVVVYEVVMRSAFNAPTTWASEISVYAFVALVFLGLAVAQRAGEHIQVEVLIHSVSPSARQQLELVGLWMTFIFAAVTGWEMFCFTVSEYINGTRDWGLLATPQWIPQTPVIVGYVLFCAAVLRDICVKTAPSARWRQIAMPLILVAIVVALAVLGRADIRIAGTRVDWQTAVIIGGLVLAAITWSGVRVGLGTLLLVGALGGLMFMTLGASIAWSGSVLVFSLLFLLLLGVPVGVSMGMVGLLGLMFAIRSPQLPMLADRSWTSINSFTLTAVPTFVLMGSLLVHSGVTIRLFDMLVTWFGRTRAGLGHATVGASAIFAAVSGSSLATAATLGRVAAPEMTARGYSSRLTYGLIAAGGTLGILIPPSIAMIIYGNTVGVPITLLFAAGVIPGLLLASLFSVVVLIWSYVVPSSVPKGEPYPMSAKIKSLGAVLPFLFLIAAVLGALYFGIATPTEAGALGAVAALALCAQQGKLSVPAIYKVLRDTVSVTAFIMLIVVGASLFGWVFDFLRIPRGLVSLVTDSTLPVWAVFLLIVLFYLILGMFIESISMMLMTLSVTFPIIVALGFDPIWFGIVLVLLVEIGLITPPVGIVLFILKGMSDVPLREIVIGVIPYILLMLAFIGLLYAFPQIVLWLPSLS